MYVAISDIIINQSVFGRRLFKFQYSKKMADKDESTSDAVTIDTNPGKFVCTPPLSEPQILSTAKT